MNIFMYLFIYKEVKRKKLYHQHVKWKVSNEYVGVCMCDEILSLVWLGQMHCFLGLVDVNVCD